MQSTTADVDTYFKQVPDARRAALTRLRELCRQTLAGYESYQGPCLKRVLVLEALPLTTEVRLGLT